MVGNKLLITWLLMIVVSFAMPKLFYFVNSQDGKNILVLNSEKEEISLNTDEEDIILYYGISNLDPKLSRKEPLSKEERDRIMQEYLQDIISER